MDLVLIRVLVNFITSFTTVRYNQKHIINDIPVKYWKLLIWRCFLGTVGYASYVYCLKFIPLFICTILLNTTPFIASVLGFFVNGDTISGIEVKLMFGAFVGIVLLALTKGGIIGTPENQVG